jgi:hypothetical protein
MDVDAPVGHHYNDGNRAFLQAILARGALNLKEGKAILAAIFTAQDGRYKSFLLAKFVLMRTCRP